MRRVVAGVGEHSERRLAVRNLAHTTPLQIIRVATMSLCSQLARTSRHTLSAARTRGFTSTARVSSEATTGGVGEIPLQKKPAGGFRGGYEADICLEAARV